MRKPMKPYYEQLYKDNYIHIIKDTDLSKLSLDALGQIFEIIRKDNKVNRKENRKIIKTIKTDKGFLCDCWEEWNCSEYENISFTDNPLEAWRFDSIDSKAPKYMRSDKMNIKTVEDACKFLDGEYVELTVVDTIEWEQTNRN